MKLFFTRVKMNLRCIGIFAGLALAGLSGCSKKQNLPVCNGSCADLVFLGNVYDSSALAPLTSVPVKIYLNEGMRGFFTPGHSYIVGNGKTGSDGTFSFSAQYDTVKFASATLEVNVSSPDNYLQYPYLVVPDVSSPSAADGASDLIFNSTDSASFSHLSFSLVQKSQLQIRMHRSTPVNNNPSLNIELRANGRSSVGGFIQSEANQDTTITAYTGINVKTFITTTKSVSATGYKQVTDTIRCTKNGENVIDVFY